MRTHTFRQTGWAYLLSTISQISTVVISGATADELLNIRNILGGRLNTCRCCLSSSSVVYWFYLKCCTSPWPHQFGQMAFLDTIYFLGGQKTIFPEAKRRHCHVFVWRDLVFSIILNVPRMWGFYLWPGLTLLVYGFVLTVSNDVNELPFPTRRLNIFALSIACLFYVNFLIDGTSHYKNFKSAHLRRSILYKLLGWML